MFSTLNTKKDVIFPLPKFTELNDLCSKSVGGKILFSTDDFFAVAENLIEDHDPVFIKDKYTEFGKWMDGWETRRKRIPGQDWCIIKLSAKSIIHGVDVDTAFFTGNYTPKYSIQAASLTEEEENLIPKRFSEMGTACSDKDLEQIGKIHSDKWQEIVPVSTLKAGFENTRHNYQKVISYEGYTHLRLNMFPDGGIARLRVFGVSCPNEFTTTEVDGKEMVDMIAMKNGGVCQGYSNAHFGHPRNLIKDGESIGMFDGWETARRLDRPETILENGDGLVFTGSEWSIFKLATKGAIDTICVDTKHFKGNFPYTVKIEGASIETMDWIPHNDRGTDWFTILPKSKLTANSAHYFECQSSAKITHAKITIAPDGGISRVRLFASIPN